MNAKNANEPVAERAANEALDVRAAGVSLPQSSNKAIQQEGVFITEEQGRTIECTERQGFWRFAQEFAHTSREAQPLAYSVDSILLPCSSVIKHFLT